MKGNYAVVLAAGRGVRMKANINKMFVPLAGKAVLEHTLSAFADTDCFEKIIIVCRASEQKLVREIAEDLFEEGQFMIVPGGKTRQDSVECGLNALPEDAEIVAVHDGARCFVRPELIQECVQSAIDFGSGVAGKHAVDTVKIASPEGRITDTIDRRKVVLVETPQVFQVHILKRAFAQAKKDGFVGTDESSLVERIGVTPRLVESVRSNFKLTNPLDLEQGRLYLMGDGESRVGNGLDVHKLVHGRDLILGGVKIDYERGLEAHSDGDVLVHAIIDAMLGAAGLPDIGELFPDTDALYKGADSVELLSRVGQALYKDGYAIGNIDATLIMQEPKISRFKERMKQNIAAALKISLTRINIKATTTEKLGAFGRGEGIGAEAVCILTKNACMIY